MLRRRFSQALPLFALPKARGSRLGRLTTIGLQRECVIVPGRGPSLDRQPGVWCERRGEAMLAHRRAKEWRGQRDSALADAKPAEWRCWGGRRWERQSSVIPQNFTPMLVVSPAVSQSTFPFCFTLAQANKNIRKSIFSPKANMISPSVIALSSVPMLPLPRRLPSQTRSNRSNNGLTRWPKDVDWTGMLVKLWMLK